MKNKKALWLLPILGLAAFIRMGGFVIAHDEPREIFNTALAMKYAQRGFEEYNLQGIEFRRVFLKNAPDLSLVYSVFNPTATKNLFQESRKRFGAGLTQLPLYPDHVFFASVLAISHRVLTDYGLPYSLFERLETQASGSVLDVSKLNLFRHQFWALFPSFVFGILTILLLYFFTKSLYGETTAVLAALVLAAEPSHLFFSTRVAPETTAGFFVILSAWIFWEAVKRRSPWGGFITGMVFVPAVLSQKDTLIFAVGFWVLSVVSEKKYYPEKNLFQLAFNWKFIGFLGGLFFMIHDWWREMFRAYQNPFYFPLLYDRLQGILSKVLNLLAERPSGLILFTLGLSGAWVVSVFSLATLKRLQDEKNVFLWACFLPAVFYFSFFPETKDLRYLLPGMSFLAVLSARGFMIFQDKIQESKNFIGLVFCRFFWISGILASIGLGLNTVFSNHATIVFPF